MSALLDTNILVAAVVAGHEAGPSCIELLSRDTRYHLSIHSLSELYNTLTRSGRYGWPQLTAMLVHQSFSAELDLLSLTEAEHVGAISDYAQSGGAGPQLYDYLIGQTALRRGLDTLITLNTRHFIHHFPQLRVVTPSAFLETT